MAVEVAAPQPIGGRGVATGEGFIIVGDRKRAISDRIGGLTIALGLGAAIACVGTGQAWATEDSSPSGGVSASSDASASTSAASADDRRPPRKDGGEPTGHRTPRSDESASPTDADAKAGNGGTDRTDEGPRQPTSRATEQDQVAGPRRGDAASANGKEAATETLEVAETHNSHSDRSTKIPDDPHRQDVRPMSPMSPIGVGDTDGLNAGATISKPSRSADVVAPSVEVLGSGPQESASPLSVSVDAVEVTSQLGADSARPSDPAKQPAGAIAKLVSTVVSAIFDPAALAGATPQAPMASPTLWTLLAFARREFDPTVSGVTPAAMATPNITTSQGISSVQSGLAVDAAKAVTPIPENLYTGQPSLLNEIVALGAKALNTILTPFGGVLAGDTLRIPFITDGVPPFFFLYGLHVTHAEFEGMPVTTLTPPNPTGKVVVAIHGGAFVGKASIFHWWTYTDMARQTGATVVVPDYTLSPAGTAETEVPRMTDFISQMIAEHGAANVSVLGDSSGGGLALLAVQELVRRDSATPGHIVLLAPWLDVSMSDPRSGQIDDPLLNVAGLAKYGKLWAGELGTQDPLVSPLFGSLDGLPPTVVYSSSRDLLTVDTLRLRDRVLAEHIPNVTFRLRKGELHDFVIYAPLPDAQAERMNLYNDLDLLGTTPSS
jgi:triacylglycerol lipase